MPTFSDILEASPDVLSESAPAAEPDRTSPVAGATDFQSILEASPDLFPGRKAVPQREKRGVIGEAVHAAVAPIKALAKAPSLLTMSDDEWYQWLKEESAKETATEPADGITGGAARIAGGLAGGVAEFAVAEAGGSAVAGPVGSVAAPALAFAGSGSVESARAAGIKALQEGKTKDEVVRISRNLAGVGAATGAGSALVFGGTGLIPKTASALARTAGTAGAGVVAGVGSQLAENIAEKKEGLDVSPTEGLLEQAIIMGLLPTVLHAKDLYRQARAVKDPAIAKTIQKSADEVAKQELAKADVSKSSPKTEREQALINGLKNWKESQADDEWAKLLESELSDQELKAGTKPTEIAETPAVRRRRLALEQEKRDQERGKRPNITGTTADQQVGAGQSVVKEVRSNELFTRADLQEHFRKTGARVPSNEEATDLLKKAWRREPEKPSAIDQILSTYKETPQPEEPKSISSTSNEEAKMDTTPPAEPEPRTDVENRIIERHRQEAQAEFYEAVAAGDKPAIRTAQKRLMQVLKVQQAPPAPAKPAIVPKPELPNVPRSSFKPEVPVTEAEAEKGISVIDEIKGSGAKTIADIQRLFPQAQLNREAARRLRDQAWGKEAEPEAKPKPPEPPEPAADTVEKPPTKPKAPAGETLTPKDLAESSKELSEMTGEEAGSDTGIDPGDKKPVVSSEPANPETQNRPWEMTQKEWVNSPEVKRSFKKASTGSRTPERAHEEWVKRALREGKEVPAEVLADYPDNGVRAKAQNAKGEKGPAPVLIEPAPADELEALKGGGERSDESLKGIAGREEWSRSDQRTFEQIKDWRARQKSGDTEPQWGRWSEWTEKAPDGSDVQVFSHPASYGDGKLHSMELRGNAVSETGYYSHIVQGIPEGISIQDYVKDFIGRRAEETKKESAKRAKFEKRQGKEKGKNAVQPESPQPVRDVLKKSESGPGEVSAAGPGAKDDARGSEEQRPEDVQASPPVGGPVKLGQWPENEWGYQHLKKLSMTERANRSRYLGLRDKGGLLEVSAKKIADRAKQRLDEVKAEAAKPKASEPPPAPEDKKPDPEWQVTVQAPQEFPGKGTVPGYIQIDKVTGGEKEWWSSNPEKLRELGYEMPDFSKLPSGKYKLSDAAEKVAVETKPKEEPPKPPTNKPTKKGVVEPEDKAAAKIEKAIDQTIVTEGAKTAREAKSQLVEELEKAIEKAPSLDSLLEGKTIEAWTKGAKKYKGPRPLAAVYRGEFETAKYTKVEEAVNNALSGQNKITIDIPGDGKFTIWNNKDALTRVLDRAKKISTSTAQSRAYSESRPSREEGQKALAEAKALAESKPLSAVPTGEGNTIEGVRAEAKKAFGTLSDRVSFVHEPDNPSAAYTDRNKIVVNAAKVAPGTVEKVMLEEGLHGVWNDPSVQDAWKEFRNTVSEYEIAAERAKRKGLDTSRETLKEEAAISKLLAKPDVPLAKGLWDTVIAALDKLFGVKVGDSREKLLEAARAFLRGGESEPDQFRFAAPTTGKAPIEQYTDELKKIEAAPVSLREKFKQAFEMGQRMAAAKDTASAAFAGLKATGDRLVKKFEGINTIDDLLRAKGELSGSTETRGWQTYQWVKWAKKAVPRTADQAAIRKWVDAGGDAAKLQEGARETKPEFRQAYVDAQNLSPENLKIAQEARKYFEAKLDEAISAGVLEDGLTDYIHRIYENHPVQRDRAVAYVQSGILRANPSLAKHRVFSFDWQAEKEGYRPVQSFIPAIAEYETSLSRAIAARKFIAKANEMMAPDNRPIIDIKGVGIPIKDADGERTGTLIKPQFNPAKANTPGTANYRGDYVTREFPALQRWKWVAADSDEKPIFVQGDVSIHPDYVHRIVSLLEPSRVRYGRLGSIMRPALAISSAFKQTMLDLSGFHQVQIAVHAVEHKVNPFNLVKDIDFENENVQGLLKGGVTIGGDYHYSGEGLFGGSLTRQIPVLGPLAESYHNWLFRDFIPRVKMTMALKALERNRERYAGKLSEEQIFNKTAMQANSAFGGLNYTMLERSKTAQDIARLILLAPDFLEARGRFAAEALSRGGKRFGNEQRTALLLGALTMYTAARVLNKVTDDQYHFEAENAFSWVINGQAYGLRTVQGDILHLLEKPLQFWMHRLNPVFGRTALEVGTQRDEFGRKRSFPEIVWDSASNIMPISLRTSRERSLWESLANGFGITDRRWQDTDKAFSLAKKWKDQHGIGERGEFIYDPDKDPLRRLKIALSRSDDSRAASEIKKLVDDKTYSLERLDQYFRHYGDMPFTGSRANDRKFMADLSDDEKITVETAKQHKEQIRKLYQRARGQYRQAQ